MLHHNRRGLVPPSYKLRWCGGKGNFHVGSISLQDLTLRGECSSEHIGFTPQSTAFMSRKQDHPD